MDWKKFLRGLDDNQLRANVKAGTLDLMVLPYSDVTTEPRPFPRALIDYYLILRNEEQVPLECASSGQWKQIYGSPTFSAGATKYQIVGAKVHPESAAEVRAREWFRGEIAKVRNGRARKLTRDQYATEAATRFGCPERRFKDRIWAVDAPETWKASGRPPV